MPTADGRQFCIIYLGGVGDGLRWLLPMSDGFARDYSLLSYVSYYPVVNYKLFSPDQITRCDVLICHHPDSSPFAEVDRYRTFLGGFGSSTRKIFVPRPVFPALWPFYNEDQTALPLPLYQPFWPAHRNEPDQSDPSQPAGVRGDRPVYPFGDQHILAKLEQGESPEKIISDYLALDVARSVDLDQLLSDSLDGIERNERTASVSVRNFIADGFRARQQFFIPDQPSNLLTLHISNGILELLGLPPISERVLERLLPFGKREAPIHPSIGRYFGAPYTGEQRRYFVDRHRYLTFAEYICGYVYSLAQDLPQGKSRNLRRDLAPDAPSMAP